MNFIFRSYPTHPWFAGWTYEPRGCNSTFRANSSDLFFKTLETVGRIIPNTEEPEWAIQIPVPQNSDINILFNGFCAYFEQKTGRHGAEIIIPEPGVIWGRSIGIPAPVIATDLPIEEGTGFKWVESETTKMLLAVRENIFCLITKDRLQTDAIELAEHYFSMDLEEKLIHEYEVRSGARSLFEDMANHDSLAAICAESIMKSLRPPEGSIPLSWCQSSSSAMPQFNLNELYPLALAWRLIDIDIAEELVSCVLKVQTNSGAIPVLYAPHTTHSVLEAPKPFLAKTLEAVWEVRKDDAFLNAMLPLLRRHLQWMLHHFDPKRRGIHCWKNRTEPIIPELYESDMATVDLTVLLLTEIEALNRLRGHSSTFSSDKEYFEEQRSTLEHNLLDQFWNNQDSAFSNAIVRDKVQSLKGFPAFTPLLWGKLPNTHRNSILESVHESGTLPGGLSVLSWRKSALDDNSFPLLQQILVFQALKTADPHGQLLRDFSRITLQGFVEWHSLSIEENNELPINPVTAAFIMNIQSMHQYRYHARGTVTGFLFKVLNKTRADRFDLIVIASTLFALYSCHLIYNVLKAPPPLPMLQAQMNSAYSNKDMDGTLKNSMAIIHHYPDQAVDAKLLAANISMFKNDFITAIELYESVRSQNPDSPGPMIALGLAYQIQGRFKDAEKNYFEFCYIFEEIFPELVQEVNHYRYLMEEGFSTPPKWQEIYRYQLMHEL
jgi:hypothetical protein